MSKATKAEIAAAGGPADVKVVQFDVPQAVPAKHVLVRVLASTATYTDLLVCAGNYRPNPPYPLTPGYDLVGDVLAIGAGVTTVAVGDRVAAMPTHGGMTTHAVLPATGVYKIPEDVDPRVAVSVVLTGVTAYQMLHRHAGLRLPPAAAPAATAAAAAPAAPAGAATAGATAAATPVARPAILVHGCVGGTGAMIVDLARIAGVPTILGTCSAKNVEAAVSSGGVTAAFDYSPTAAGGTWDQRVLAATDGKGVDAVFDAVVLGDYLTKGLQVLVPRGHYVAYGVTNASSPGAVNVSSTLSAFARIAGQQALAAVGLGGGKRALFYNITRLQKSHPDHFRGDLAGLMALVRDGRLTPLTAGKGRLWPLAEAPAALASIAANTHRGKQIIECAPMGPLPGVSAASADATAPAAVATTAPAAPASSAAAVGGAGTSTTGPAVAESSPASAAVTTPAAPVTAPAAEAAVAPAAAVVSTQPTGEVPAAATATSAPAAEPTSAAPVAADAAAAPPDASAPTTDASANAGASAPTTAASADAGASAQPVA